MKRIVVFLYAGVLTLAMLAMLAAVGGTVVYFCNNEKFLADKISNELNRQLIGMTVSELKIGRAVWSSINRVHLTDVTFKLIQEETRYEVRVPGLKVGVDGNIFYPGVDFYVDVQQAWMMSEQFEVNALDAGFTGRWERGQLKRLTGNWKAAELSVQNKKLTRIGSDVWAAGSQYAFKDVNALLGTGRFSGHGVLIFQTEPHFDVVLKFEEVDVRQLADGLTDVRGNVSGLLSVAGTLSGVQSFRLDVAASPGSQIKAALLQTVIERIPANTQQRKELDKLIAAKGFLPLDSALGKIETTSAGSAKGEFEIYSHDLNLAVKYPIQINTDGSWENLFNKGLSNK